YYDSSATAPKDTRLDFDTLPKLAGTFGLGYSVRGFAINLAYAYVYEFPRVVTDGDIAPVNGAAHGDPVDDAGNPLPAVHNGRYHGQTHIISFGVTLRFDELAGRKHRPRWPDEESAAAATPPRPPIARAAAPAVERDDATEAEPEAEPAAVESERAAPATRAPAAHARHKKAPARKKRNKHQARRTR
ncbi:MAG: hypothetical protein ACXVDD_09460, partial [Polyangia bacterium]